MAKNKAKKGEAPEDEAEEPKNAKAKGGKKAKPEAEDAEPAEGEGAEGDAPKKKLGVVKLAIFIGAPVLLIVIGLGVAFLLGLFGGKKHDAKDAAGDKVESVDGKPVAADVQFLDLPEILVNLNNSGKSSSFLKLQLAIELPKEAQVALVQPALPRIMDRFQVFLRELRVEDLAGSAGTYRLKQELLRRVRLSGLSVPVNDVLIREMIIQ